MFKAAKLATFAGLVFVSSIAAAADDGFAKKFPVSSCEFSSWGGNAYFPLIPGRQLYY
jgi:hypothetical protein